MPESSITQNSPLHEGERVRIVGPLDYRLNPYRGMAGTITHSGHSTEGPLYLVKLDAFGRVLVFLRDELERVESEAQG
jgi:hypothetical protein